MTRACRWCDEPFDGSPRQEFCSKRCRQTAWRLRGRSSLADPATSPLEERRTPGRFAYADPPYPGNAAKYYRQEPSYAGEVDHAALIASLIDRDFTGWALSTSAKALRDVLPLCPSGVRVCAWVKPIGASSSTWGTHSRWEAVIVAGGRPLRPGVRDWLRAMPARGGGSLMGRKPVAFCAWLFDLLGMLPGDELVDLFPGTGVLARSWRELAAFPRPRGVGDVVGDVAALRDARSSSDRRHSATPAPRDAHPAVAAAGAAR